MASLSDLAVQSNAVAQQNNPEFAALNTIVQSRTMPFNGFGEFIRNTLEPERNRQHQKQLLEQQFKNQRQLDADTYRRSLEHTADLQGINADYSKMSNSDI